MARGFSKKKRKAAGQQRASSIAKENLDRFAGSSDEDDDESNSGRDQHSKPEVDGIRNDDRCDDKDDEADRSDSESDEQEYSALNGSNDDEHEGSTSEDDEIFAEEISRAGSNRKAGGTQGMANAMARILRAATIQREQRDQNSRTKSSSAVVAQPVVLSKTKTPIQRMAERERKERVELQQKRRVNRERSLAALHVPLSVATTRLLGASGGGGGIGTGTSEGFGRELEQERAHRRVATRGVVALFNAIAQHQKRGPPTLSPDAATTTSPTTSTKGNKMNMADGGVQKMTKHGFLDMIKNTASKRARQEEKEQQQQQRKKAKEGGYGANSKGGGGGGGGEEESNKQQKWNALRDDFMMDSKKNWDQVSSSDDDSGEEIGGAAARKVGKKQKVR